MAKEDTPMTTAVRGVDIGTVPRMSMRTRLGGKNPKLAIVLAVVIIVLASLALLNHF